MNSLKKFIKERLPSFFAGSGFLASLYYTFVSTTFRREHYSVLQGKVNYFKQQQKDDSYFLLVRNTHRIEKGLLMRPRRATFAQKYIHDTVKAYSKLRLDTPAIKQQKKWFTDVLTAYFEATATSDAKEIQNSRVLFEQAIETKPSQQQPQQFIPYLRREAEKPGINFESFFRLCRYRRSVRWFLDKEVPRHLIDQAISAALQSPSACNRQPFFYHVIDDPALVEEAVKLPMGTAGYAHSIKTFIICVGKLDAYSEERDRHLIYVDGSLANMTLMLALETLGLSSVPINWPDIEKREQKMAKFLNLSPYERPVMCLGIGYPDPEGMVARSEKISLDKARSYNKGS